MLPLRSIARSVVPGRVGRLRRKLAQAITRTRAGTIPFFSGLGDSSNLLYGLARSMKPQVCVEIGSARGNSTCAIAMALKENGHGKLYAIDPHTSTSWNDSNSVNTFEVLQKNLATLGLVAQVEIIRALSGEVARSWTRPIDLIFIDGDHSYEGVRADWDLFAPHVSPFGIAAFHDTMWDLNPDSQWSRSDMGVPRLVDELRQQGYQVLTIDKDCGISLVQPTVGGIPLRLHRS